MPSTSLLSAFHHWFLSEPPPECRACSIVLSAHHRSGPITAPLARDLAVYLNEYDDKSIGRWLAVAPELVAAIAGDPSNRQLLGLSEGCANCPPTSQCGLKKVLTSLAQRGHVILDSPLATHATQGLQNIFHASIGLPEEASKHFHFAINPDQFGPNRVAQLVGDVFLEWLNRDERPSPPQPVTH